MNEIFSNEDLLPEHIRRILAAFDFLDGPVPKKAILEAREHREEIIPELLDAFRKEIETPEDQRKFESWLPTIALYLLVEFRAKEALPIVFRSLHYSKQAIEDIYCDSLTEDMAGILYYLGVEPEMLDSLVRNEKLYWFVRWEALKCFYYFVRDGRMKEKELTDRFQVWLQETIGAGDEDMTTALASELASCGTESALPVIKQAYDKDLVDTFFVGKWDDLEKYIRVDKPSIEQNFERLDDYTDTVETMGDWHCFQPKKPERVKRTRSPNKSQTFADEPTEPRKQKVGRNDPCPCGSGKKFKKCCWK